jgi:HD-like signal output (HDOD) protein
LLHDLGIPVMARAFGSRYRPILDRAKETTTPLWDLEREAFGYGHPEVGAALLRSWKFPEGVAMAAAHHHLPGGAPARYRPWVQVISLADWISEHAGYGLPIEENSLPIMEGVWFDVGVPIEATTEIIMDFDVAAGRSKNLVSAACRPV